MASDKWASKQCTTAWKKVNNKYYPESSCSKDVQKARGDLLYNVPADLRDLLFELCQESGIPYVVAANLIGSESGFKNAKSTTGARGICQFTGDTLYERLYKSKDKLPDYAQKIVEDNIERYKKDPKAEHPEYKYRIKEVENIKGKSKEKIKEEKIKREKAVLALAEDKKVALVLGFDHMLFCLKEGTRVYKERLEDRIKWMNLNRYAGILKETEDKIEAAKPNLSTEELELLKKELRKEEEIKAVEIDKELEPRLNEMTAEINREMTAIDLKIFYVCGASGGATLLEALADSEKQNHRALDYVLPSVVKANPELFFKKNSKGEEKPRSLTEFRDHIKGLVGEMPVPRELTSNGVKAAGLNPDDKNITASLTTNSTGFPKV
ncbi:MAG: hypothetical protein OEY94_08265 [Alphaproteobacteria bacterium]|nr:hypothetical protein [Alphaproteobacteria bacterium]